MEPEETPSTKLVIKSNALYDNLKKVVQFVLPAAGTLYFTLAQIWGLPNGEQVVGSIAAVALFGGVLLGLSNRAYNNSDAKYDGELNVSEKDDGTQVYDLAVSTDMELWPEKGQLTLKVHKPE